MLLDQLICGGAIIKVSGEELKKKKKSRQFFLFDSSRCHSLSASWPTIVKPSLRTYERGKTRVLTYSKR